MLPSRVLLKHLLEEEKLLDLESLNVIIICFQGMSLSEYLNLKGSIYL